VDEVDEDKTIKHFNGWLEEEGEEEVEPAYSKEIFQIVLVVSMGSMGGAKRLPQS
jgi:hypothetical protein